MATSDRTKEQHYKFIEDDESMLKFKDENKVESRYCPHCQTEIRSATKKLIAKWSSKGGKHWVELYSHQDGGYTYTANDAGGNLGNFANDELAIKKMQEKVDSGYFLPDAAKTPMKRARTSYTRPDVGSSMERIK